jgi:hypothetical protein
MQPGSHDAAMAIGTGKIVRRPWITSNPKRTRIPCRLPFDGQPLQPVHLHRVSDEQQRPNFSLASAASTIDG